MRGADHAELRAFAAIAQHGSFVRAASHLGISPSALSQTIRSLEERLGVRLLNRTTRSVAPSDAGARFLARLLPALEDLDAAVADVRAERDVPSGLLRINAPRMAAIHELAPLIGAFNAAYPEIVLDIMVEDRLVDIVAERFDAGIRLGEMVAKDMVTVPLGGDVRQMAVASPAYLARAGTPASPSDLRRHACINLRWPTDRSLYHWEFEHDGRALDVAVEGPLIVTEPDVAMRAALDGVGIAYLFEHLVREAVAAGQLVQVLADWTPAFPGLHVYYPSRRQMAPALRAFLDFIKAARGYSSRHRSPARSRP